LTFAIPGLSVSYADLKEVLDRRHSAACVHDASQTLGAFRVINCAKLAGGSPKVQMKQWRNAVNPRINLALGLFCAAIAVSIMAVDVPYYAIVASIAIVVIFGTWLILVLRARSSRSD
jgi:hypothetical protein